MSFRASLRAAPALFVLVACASEDALTIPDGPITFDSTQQAIQGGQTTSDYPFVLGMIAAVSGAYGVCTATLIAPNLALTARHCVSDVSSENIDCRRTRFTKDSPAGNLAVTAKSQLSQNERDYYGVRKVILPSDKDMCGHDIALMILDENIPSSIATPIEPAIHESIEIGDRGVTAITAIGYGTTDGRNNSGVRRIRENIPLLCAYGHPTGRLDCDKVPQDLSTLMTDSDFIVDQGVCQGDSGSSAFEQSAFDDGVYRSIGVLSRGPGGGCEMGVYTRLDAQKDLIIDAAKQAAELGGYPVPAWVKAPLDPNDPPTSPEDKKSLGETCEAPADCESDVCVEDGDSAVCSKACADSEECDEGFACSDDGYCLAIEQAPTTSGKKKKKEDTTTIGCSVSSDPTKPIPWRSGSSAAVLATAVALLLRRRPRASR